MARIEALLAEVREMRVLQEELITDAEELMSAIRHETFTELASQAPTKRFGEITDSRLGKMLSQQATAGEYLRPYLRNANVQWDHFLLDDLYKMDFPPEDQEKYRVHPGDILICEGGEIGRTAVWEGQIEEIYFQKALHRARLLDHNAPPRYIMHFIAWAVRSGEIAKLMTGAAIPHLTGVKLKLLDVIWPEPIIQLQIVEYLDRMKSEIDDMKSIQSVDHELLQHVEQAILTQAFRGEL